jgi:SAM-dependent methyltransferase
MFSLSDAVRNHYQAGISDRDALLARVRSAIGDLEGPVTASTLAAFDQFHVGGLTATAEFARCIGIEPGARVLDAGSGLGGPSRYLAETFACRVDGVDLSPDYVAIAQLVSESIGFADRFTITSAT